MCFSLMDSHVFNTEFLTPMRDNNVHFVCFSPHTTHSPASWQHILQKRRWSLEVQIYTRENGGRKMQRPLLLPQNAQAGFRLYPLDPTRIDQALFSSHLRKCSTWGIQDPNHQALIQVILHQALFQTFVKALYKETHALLTWLIYPSVSMLPRVSGQNP